MSEEVTDLSPTGQPVALSLGFEARSVMVINYTSSFVRLPDAGFDLPPWVYGAVVPLPAGLRTARASLVPTVPAVSGPPVPVSKATLAWFDVELPIDPGHLLQQSTTAPGAEIASLTSPGNSTGTVTLPAGTQSLVIVTQVGAADTSFLSLTGAASSFVYYSQTLGSSAYEIIGVESSVDAVLNYTVGHGTGPGCSFFLTALPFPPPTFITRTPAPWQVGTTPAPINQVVAFGTSFTWKAPPAGRKLRLFPGFIHWRTSANGFGKIGGDGATGQLFEYDQVATNFFELTCNGIALAVGENLVITNDDVANGSAVRGGLLVTPD